MQRRKELLLTALTFFTIGSLIAGAAKNFTTLLAGRCCQGIGGGGIITMGQIIFADIVPLRQRPKWFSIVLAAWAIGSVLGPLVGGLFVDHLSWRWTFYINIPFCAIGAVMIPLFVKLKTMRTSLIDKLRRVDYIGAFLFIGSMTSFLIGLSWAGVQFAWLSIQTLLPLGVGVGGVVLSIFYEFKWAPEPFLRRSLFYNGSAIAAYCCALVQGLLVSHPNPPFAPSATIGNSVQALLCSILCTVLFHCHPRCDVSLLAPSELDISHTELVRSPTTSGVNLLPVTCFLMPGSAVVSLLITKLGHFRWAVWSGWVITCVGSGLLQLFKEGVKTPVWVGVFIVFGIGNGMVLSSVNFSIQAIAHTEDCGRAASTYAFFRTLGRLAWFFPLTQD